MIEVAKKPAKRLLYGVDRWLYRSGIRSLDRLTLPQFLVLGPGQSGTTWLHVLLGTHPEVFLPDKKETHYFDRQLDGWPLAYYASLFSEGAGKVKGEICPLYNILRGDRIHLIRRILPDVRLVLILRNPVERSWSEARRSMYKIATQRGVGLDEIKDSEFYSYFDKEWTCMPDYFGDYDPELRQGHYSRCIDNWLSYFPAEQLQICFFDDIEKNPVAFLGSICKHIGVDDHFAWPVENLRSVVNKNPELRIPERFHRSLENRYAVEIEELYRRFGAPVEKWRCMR